ncbi:ATP-binding protein, partial [Acinetobacter baumannii]
VDSAGRQGIVIGVSDSGIGMSTEQQARLFEPFVQADSTISRRFGGSGLGLALCRRLVDLMGGTISLRSAPGDGSQFTVTLPFAPTES